MTWMMEHICEKTYYETVMFKMVQSTKKRIYNLNKIPNGSQIFKWVKILKPHGMSESLRATGSSPSEPPVVQEEWARIINTFA